MLLNGLANTGRAGNLKGGAGTSSNRIRSLNRIGELLKTPRSFGNSTGAIVEMLRERSVYLTGKRAPDKALGARQAVTASGEAISKLACRARKAGYGFDGTASEGGAAGAAVLRLDRST